MLHLAESIPTDIMREPGFANWVVYLIVFIMVVDRLRGWVMPSKREISGRIQTDEVKEPANAEEVEDELQRIESTLKDMSEDIERKHKELITAGQERADKITKRIDDEISVIRADISSRMTQIHDRVNSAKESIAAHTAQIADLQARDHSHDQQLLTLRHAAGKPPR